MPRFEIPVKQYNSAKHAPGHPIDLPPCIINDRQLTVAMVRSILTHNPGRIARRFTAAIVRPTLLFILDWTRPPEMSLNPRIHGVLRDFSITTRVGELAQGVAYSYWHWHRGFRIVTDFVSIATNAGISIPTGSQAPDYIMFDPITGDLVLMEAKGTRSACHTQAMAKAMRQCRAAQTYAPVPRAYGCVLALDSPAGSSVLHVRDPEKPMEISPILRHDLFRHSYGSWFELAGFQRVADWCRTPIRRAGRLDFNQSLAEDQPDVNDPLRHLVGQSLGFNPESVMFDIAPEVAAALSDLTAFQRLDWRGVKVSTEVNSNESGAPLHFPDGTSIM